MCASTAEMSSLNIEMQCTLPSRTTRLRLVDCPTFTYTQAEYCLRAECRRAFLLAHFGETLPAGHRCEGCDLCDDAQVRGAQGWEGPTLSPTFHEHLLTPAK
jgi:hypothetical protein